MIAAELAGTLDDARRFLERCRLFALAESLGGVESLIEHPALMTHGSVPPEVRAELGIGDTLVRLSVGIEDADDLIADLSAALGGGIMASNDADATANVSHDYVLYDGACPACSRYIVATGLADGRDIALIDARTAPALVAEHAAAGRKIDDGMVVAIDGVVHY